MEGQGFSFLLHSAATPSRAHPAVDDTTMLSHFIPLLALVASAVVALPAPQKLTARQTISALGASQISSFTPYSYYASAGYCAASTTADWSCGANCEANPGFVPVASGGDGDDVQYCTESC